MSTPAKKQILLTSAVKQYTEKARQITKDLAEKKITKQQHKRRMTELENRHKKIIRKIERGTAPIEWYRAAEESVESVKDQLARYATDTAKEVQKKYAKGEIDKAQRDEMFKQIEEQHMKNLEKTEKGTLRYVPFKLSYTKIEKTKTPTRKPDDLPLTTHREREATTTQVLSQAKGRPVFYDPETNEYYWYEGDIPDEVKPLEKGSFEDLWTRYRYGRQDEPPVGSIAYGIGKTFEKWDESLSVISKPLEIESEKLSEKSLELAAKGKPWEGLYGYMGSTAIHGVGSFYKGFTFAINPLAQTRAVSSIVTLATEPAARDELWSEIARDPVRFTVGVGGSVAGGYAFGKGVSVIKQRLGLDKPVDYQLKKVKVPKKDVIYEEDLPPTDLSIDTTSHPKFGEMKEFFEGDYDAAKWGKTDSGIVGFKKPKGTYRPRKSWVEGSTKLKDSAISQRADAILKSTPKVDKLDWYLGYLKRQAIKKSRGSVILHPNIRVGPRMIEVFKPIPIYDRTLLGPVSGVMGAISYLDSAPSVDKSIPKLGSRTIEDFKIKETIVSDMVKGQLTRIQYTPEKIDIALDIKTKLLLGGISKTLVKQDIESMLGSTQVQVDTQVQLQRQKQRQRQLLKQKLQITSKKIEIPLKKKKKKKKIAKDQEDIFGFEKRKYAGLSPEELISLDSSKKSSKKRDETLVL